MNESELIETGPNYSHTTNGRELEYQLCRIFVGHLPVDYLSKDDIYAIFEAYGKILAIRNELNWWIMTPEVIAPLVVVIFLISKWSLHKGYCFVQFKTPEMAKEAATAQNGRRVKNSCLEVNLATISKEEVTNSSNIQSMITSFKHYVT